MKFIMFRPQWIEPILQGTKVQTIRPPRKIPIVVGEALSLRIWTGLPYTSKQKTLLDTHCTSVYAVTIDDGGVVGENDGPYFGGRLETEATEHFARRDGFASFEAMQQFFREMHGLPFKGTAISWD